MAVSIQGLEVEHGVQVTGLARERTAGLRFGPHQLDLQVHAAKLLLDAVPEDPAVAELMAASWPNTGALLMPRRFLVNGAYLHWETGGNIEYAGPECATPTDVVRADEAGKRVLTALVAAVNKEYDLDGGFRLIRNNSGVGELGGIATCGSDECFRVPESLVDELTASGGGLLPHLVTRQIYTSAGEVVAGRKGDDWSLLLSSRARFINTTHGRGHWDGERAMIKLAANYDTSGWRRIQVACGDTTMSQWSNLLRIGTTALVVEMLRRPEYRKLFHSLALRRPVFELRRVARDVDLERHSVGMNSVLMPTDPDAPKMTALEMQSVILGAASEFVERGGGTPDAPLIIDLWGQALTALGSGWDGLSGSADFATKFTLIERRLARSPGAPFADLRREDIRYHTVGHGGVQQHLAATGAMPAVVSDIDALITHPPKGTRAEPRSALLRAVLAAGRGPCAVNWDCVQWETREVEMPDPTAAYRRSVAREVATLQGLGDTGRHLSA